MKNKEHIYFLKRIYQIGFMYFIIFSYPLKRWHLKQLPLLLLLPR